MGAEEEMRGGSGRKRGGGGDDDDLGCYFCCLPINFILTDKITSIISSSNDFISKLTLQVNRETHPRNGSLKTTVGRAIASSP